MTIGDGTINAPRIAKFPIYLSGQRDLPDWGLELYIQSADDISDIFFVPENDLPEGITFTFDDDVFPNLLSLSSDSANISLPDQSRVGSFYVVFEEEIDLPVPNIRVIPWGAYLNQEQGDDAALHIPFILLNNRLFSDTPEVLEVDSIAMSPISCLSEEDEFATVLFDFGAGQENLQISSQLPFTYQQGLLRVDSIKTNIVYRVSATNPLLNEHLTAYILTADYSPLPDRILTDAKLTDLCNESLGITVNITNVDLDSNFTVVWEDSIHAFQLDSFIPNSIIGSLELSYGHCSMNGRFFTNVLDKPISLELEQPVHDFRCGSDEFTLGRAFLDTTNLPDTLWPLDIYWSTGDTGLVIEDLSPGVYRCEVGFAGNCLLSDTFEVEVDSLYYSDPAPGSFMFINYDSYLIQGRCGDYLNIIDEQYKVRFINVDPVLEPFEYAWSTGDTTPTLNGLGLEGPLSVVLTDALGCSYILETTAANDTFELPSNILFPIAVKKARGADDCIFAGGSITIDTSGLEPELLPLNVVWSDGQTGSAINGLLPGEYSCTITANNGECQVEETRTVSTSSFVFFDRQVTPILDQTSCDTRYSSFAIQLDSSQFLVDGILPTITWPDGQTGFSAVVLALDSTNYVVDFENGCSISKRITLPAANLVEIELVKPLCNTPTGSVLVSVNNDETYGYLWNTGQVGP